MYLLFPKCFRTTFARELRKSVVPLINRLVLFLPMLSAKNRFCLFVCLFVLTNFHTVTEKNVRETIQKMPSKTCELDPIPALLLLECIDEIAPVLTDIVNARLSTGSVPDSSKQAIV